MVDPFQQRVKYTAIPGNKLSRLNQSIVITSFLSVVVGAAYTMMGPQAVLGESTLLRHLSGLSIFGFELDASQSRLLALGANYSMAGIGNLIVIPFIPWLVRGLGEITVGISACIVMGICMLLFTVTDFSAWFWLRLLFHIAYGVLFVLIEYWVVFDAEKQFRGFSLGVYGTMLAVGLALGPVVILICESLGISALIAGCLLFVASSAVISVKRRPAARTLQYAKGFNWVSAISRHKLPCLGGFLFGFAEYGAGFLLVKYAMSIGFSSEQALLAISTMFIANTAFQLPIGILADKINDRLLCCLIAIWGAVMVLTLVFPVTFVLWLVLVFLSFGPLSGLYTTGLHNVAGNTEDGQLVSVNALFMYMYSLGMLIGPIALAAAMMFSPYGFVFGLAAPLLAFGIWFLFSLFATDS